MTAGAPDRLVLRWLARRTGETATGIGSACGLVPGEVRACLAALESQRLIASREDKDTIPARRVYYVTAEGRRAAGIIDTRSTANL